MQKSINLKKQRNKGAVNWFVRIAVILLASLIFTMVIFKFFFNEPISDISPGLIILIAFLMILVLSESFDNFSIGKIISLSRQLKKEEAKVDQVKSEKKELLSQIISLTNSVSQKQSNTNIYGLPTDFAKHYEVEKVSEDEKEIIEEEELGTHTSIKSRRRLDSEKIEEFVFDKYIEDNNADVSQIYKKVKLKAFDGIDPISDSSPIYDGYVKEISRELFIEIRSDQYISSLFNDRLYKMLSKIHHYRQVRKTNAVLILVLVEVPPIDGIQKTRKFPSYTNRIWNDFEPAINSGILKLKIMKIDEKDAESYYI